MEPAMRWENRSESRLLLGYVAGRAWVLQEREKDVIIMIPALIL